MNISAYLRKTVHVAIIGSILSLSIQAPVMARMIDNDQISASAQAQQQRSEVKAMLARDDIKRTLVDYGVDSTNVDNRVSQMTDSEIAQIHQHLSELPAGAGAAGAVLTILLILILLDVVGVTNIFPKI
ncbi:MAG: PA2779 family protein [Gammaproteobacteria bacterium]|nr:PA2779 family protein [Gammaproteobacteria bacterium]